MALFTNGPDDWQRLDWQILRDGGIALYWREEYLAADVEWLVAQSYDIYSFECKRWASKDDMLSDIGRTLRFPDWWGRNFDALNDCLTDLTIRADGGAVLVFHKFNLYASGPGSALMPSGRTQAEVLLDVLAGACRFSLLNGKRFIVLVQTENPNIHIGPLDGVSPVWNRREWLNKNRTRDSPSIPKTD